MKDNLLEIGDEMYCEHGFNDEMRYIGKVSRVTKTMAFIDNLRLKRQYNNGTKTSGADDWDRTYYYLLTSGKREILKHQVYRRKLGSIIYKWGANNLHEAVRLLPDKKLEQIAAILKDES